MAEDNGGKREAVLKKRAQIVLRDLDTAVSDRSKDGLRTRLSGLVEDLSRDSLAAKRAVKVAMRLYGHARRLHAKKADAKKTNDELGALKARCLALEQELQAAKAFDNPFIVRDLMALNPRAQDYNEGIQKLIQIDATLYDGSDSKLNAAVETVLNPNYTKHLFNLVRDSYGHEDYDFAKYQITKGLSPLSISQLAIELIGLRTGTVMSVAGDIVPCLISKGPNILSYLLQKQIVENATLEDDPSAVANYLNELRNCSSAGDVTKTSRELAHTDNWMRLAAILLSDPETREVVYEEPKPSDSPPKLRAESLIELSDMIKGVRAKLETY